MTKRNGKKKAAKKTAKRKPKGNGIKPKETDRDDKGLFQPGCAPGPGRPKGIDFRRVCEEKAEAEGYDLEDAVWVMFKDQVAKAKSREVARITKNGKVVKLTQEGDTKAAQLAWDRICGPLAQQIDITGQQTVTLVPATDRQAMLDNASDVDVQDAELSSIRERTNGRA